MPTCMSSLMLSEQYMVSKQRAHLYAWKQKVTSSVG